MPYFIGIKLTRISSEIHVNPCGNLEEAHIKYAHLNNTKSLDEIIIPPFFADSEDEARKKARKLISA